MRFWRSHTGSCCDARDWTFADSPGTRSSARTTATVPLDDHRQRDRPQAGEGDQRDHGGDGGARPHRAFQGQQRSGEAEQSHQACRHSGAASPSSDRDTRRQRAHIEAETVGDGVGERSATTAEVDAVAGIHDVPRPHQRVWTGHLEQGGEPEICAEHHERGEQHLSLALGRVDDRSEVEDEERKQTVGLDNLQQGRALSQGVRDERVADRPQSREGEHVVDRPEPGEWLAASGRRPDHHHHDRRRDEDPIRGEDARDPELLPVAGKRRQHHSRGEDRRGIDRQRQVDHNGHQQNQERGGGERAVGLDAQRHRCRSEADRGPRSRPPASAAS